MCDHSFSATADTLKELVDIVALHLKEMERHHDEAHHNFLEHHSKDEYSSSAILKDYHEHPSAILKSDAFRWDIQRLVPFNEIFDVIKTQVTPLETDLGVRLETKSQPKIAPKMP